VVFLAIPALTFFITKPRFLPYLDDDQNLSDECGGNGRQIVPCDDISDRYGTGYLARMW
jgi:hypothetical protein